MTPARPVSLLSRVVIAAALASLPAAPAFAQTAAAAEPETGNYTPSPENLAARQWFGEARFGVFLHWGLYSSLGGGGDKDVAEWIMENRKIPAKRYERLAQFFNPVKFDASQWVRTIKAAGARYIVITSKHHDGFAMYASAVSPYNVMNTPFHRDPIAELAAACRREGIKLFFYYSQLDWHHPDYFPRGRTGNHSGRIEAGDWEKYLDYQDAQLTELLTRYGPIGGIWFDGWWDQQKTAMRDRWRLSRTYQLIHRLQPGAMIVNNHHVAPFPGEDYQAFERDLPGENTHGYNDAAASTTLPLEMAETMNGSWGFNFVDDKFKSTQALIATLAGAAGRGTNFLLNTGPMPDGRLQPENVETLNAIGAWLRVNGESVYGTRAGPVAPQDWGVTTQAGKRVFVHLLRDPGASLTLPIKRVRAARMLDGGGVVRTRVSKGEVTLLGLKRPAELGDQVIVLELD